MKFLRTIGLISLTTLSFSAFSAVIDHTDISTGQHSDTVGHGVITVSAWNDSAQTSAAKIGYRSQGPGIGVVGQQNNEIDFYETDSEALAFDFTEEANIQSLVLTLLFNGPEYNDVYETAQIEIDGYTGVLALTGENTASWSVNGSFVKTVTACDSTATQWGGTGCFEILNPFGDALTQNMDLTALDGVGTGDESDYLFSRLQYVTVPEPGTLALLIIGLICLGASRRRVSKLA